jgi:hypothetical protein
LLRPDGEVEDAHQHAEALDHLRGRHTRPRPCRRPALIDVSRLDPPHGAPGEARFDPQAPGGFVADLRLLLVRLHGTPARRPPQTQWPVPGPLVDRRAGVELCALSPARLPLLASWRTSAAPGASVASRRRGSGPGIGRRAACEPPPATPGACHYTARHWRWLPLLLAAYGTVALRFPKPCVAGSNPAGGTTTARDPSFPLKITAVM